MDVLLTFCIGIYFGINLYAAENNRKILESELDEANAENLHNFELN